MYEFIIFIDGDFLVSGVLVIFTQLNLTENYGNAIILMVC
jgi:hypothetical protein